MKNIHLPFRLLLLLIFLFLPRFRAVWQTISLLSSSLYSLKYFMLYFDLRFDDECFIFFCDSLENNLRHLKQTDRFYNFYTYLLKYAMVVESLDLLHENNFVNDVGRERGNCFERYKNGYVFGKAYYLIFAKTGFHKIFKRIL